MPNPKYGTLRGDEPQPGQYVHRLTWAALVAAAQTPPPDNGYYNASLNGGSTFTGTKNYEEALGLLLCGWPEGLRKLALLQRK